MIRWPDDPEIHDQAQTHIWVSRLSLPVLSTQSCCFSASVFLLLNWLLPLRILPGMYIPPLVCGALGLQGLREQVEGAASGLTSKPSGYCT